MKVFSWGPVGLPAELIQEPINREKNRRCSHLQVDINFAAYNPVFVKFPNFLSVEKKPFDPDYYEEDEEEDTLDAEGRSRLKLKVPFLTQFQGLGLKSPLSIFFSVSLSPSLCFFISLFLSPTLIFSVSLSFFLSISFYLSRSLLSLDLKLII